MLPDFSRLAKLIPDFSSFIRQLQGYKEEVQELYGNAWFAIEQQKALGAYLRMPEMPFSMEDLRKLFGPPDLNQIRRNLALPGALSASEESAPSETDSNTLLPAGNLHENIFPEITAQQNEIQTLQERVINMLPSREVLGGMLLPSELLGTVIEGVRSSSKWLLNPIVNATLQLPSAYQRFVYHELSKAERDQAEIRQRRIQVIELSGDLLTRSQISNEIATTLFSELAEQASAGKLKINLFSMLNQHLAHLYKLDRNENVYQAFLECIPSRVNCLGGAIVELIYRINQYSQRKSGEWIFKPTNKSLYACMQLPSLIVDNDGDFGLIVDHLYFLTYEGSGGAKRLTGILTDEELDPLWKLKHLRLGYRHDVEHGEESTIRTKEMTIGAAYQDLIGKPTPVTAAHWKEAQLMVYKQLAEMLKLVRERQERMVE